MSITRDVDACAEGRSLRKKERYEAIFRGLNGNSRPFVPEQL
jgi:hypothetical protein